MITKTVSVPIVLGAVVCLGKACTEDVGEK
jgi:hypothetical protein